MSKKIARWGEFAIAVTDHLRNYVLPQYGDDDVDLAKDYSVEDCIKQAQKYLARYGKQSRPGEEKRDLVKAAHYVQMAWSKLP